ncbi:TrkA family potassium uptake protein [Candidatus Dependentiae bacterium]|nr:TrkA family potassium uptake protein [Candidatus Dependentiae bacterium]
MRSFAVIGLGEFGFSIAKTLSELGAEVIAIDESPERIKLIDSIVTKAITLDATNEKAIKSVGIENVDVAIIAIGKKLEASILVALMLKEIGIKRIVAKAISEIQGRLLARVGADEVVFPEVESGERIANSLVSSSINDFIKLSSEYAVVEIIPPTEFYNKSLSELSLRSKYNINVIGIRPEDDSDNIKILPLAEDVITEGDMLIVIGAVKDLDKFKKKK